MPFNERATIQAHALEKQKKCINKMLVMIR